MNLPTVDPSPAELATRLAPALGSVLSGKPDAIDLTLVALLAGGHVLIEDVPGVGKTVLARTLARALDASSHRIQFTADLLPGDITGVAVFNQQTGSFSFSPGGVFANVVIADEINRASPKTQSALLEAMEEASVTVDGVTHPLPEPFMVVATQNPIEMAGTFPLPEAQRDRFMLSMSVGYPDADAESAMLERHVGGNPLETLQPVATASEVMGARAAVRRVFLHENLRRYIVSTLAATRTDPALALGASPRAGIQWARAAQARAAMAGRDYVIPEDLASLAGPVLGHRLIATDRRLTGAELSSLASTIVGRVPAPRQA